MAYDNTVQIEGRARPPANQPSLQLAQIARSIDEPGGIMAPWWLSPGLLYFSGQPIVSGSSHCGISGIVASAKFYSATSWVDAERILRERQVRWVVVWDDPVYEYPLLNTRSAFWACPVSRRRQRRRRLDRGANPDLGPVPADLAIACAASRRSSSSTNMCRMVIDHSSTHSPVWVR